MPQTNPPRPLTPEQTKRLITTISSTIGIVTSLALLGFANAAWINYKNWLSLGPGGLPYSPLGWLIQWTVRPFVKSNASLRESADFYDADEVEKYGPLSAMSFLTEELPQRKGMRPVVPAFVAPQRQGVGWGNGESVRELQKQELSNILTDNPELLTMADSKLEGYGFALFLQPHLVSPPGTARLGNEVAHFHLHTWPGGMPDGSGHVILSLTDAAEVVEKGWGQKHMLSGALGFPLGYVMVYAPRDEKEVQIMGRIMRAGVGYMSGRK